MDISIIIAVYNKENFIAKCLDSIFSQKFSGAFEVIAVDDASTDNSAVVLDLYQKSHPSLKIFKHSINKKLSVARSTGMKEAKGKFLMHVDADDWLLPDSLETLYKKCKVTAADVVVFGMIREDSTGKRLPGKLIKREFITNDKLKIQYLFYGSACNKIVRRELTEKLLYGRKPINNTEDLIYASEILFRAKRFCLTPEVFYVYFANTQSSTHTISPDQYLENQSVIFEELKLLINRYNPDNKLVINILSYMEKWILEMVCQLHFFHNKVFQNHSTIVGHFRTYPELSSNRIYLLSKAMINKYYCWMYCLARLSPRFTLSFLIKVSKHKIDKLFKALLRN